MAHSFIFVFPKLFDEEFYKNIFSGGIRTVVLRCQRQPFDHLYYCASNEQCLWLLQCSDGLLLTHRPVLAGSSPFLKDVLAELNGDDLTTLVLPEISRSVVEALLALLYAGKANLYQRLVKLKPRKPLSTR